MIAPHDDLTHAYPRTLEEAFGPGERGPVVAPNDPPRGWRDTRVLWAVPVAVLVLTGVIGYELMGRAFVQGFEQGYVEGNASAELSEHEVFLQCTEWWFDGSESRAKQAINQYCDRRLK